MKLAWPYTSFEHARLPLHIYIGIYIDKDIFIEHFTLENVVTV